MSPTLTLHDTATRAKRPFAPIRPDRVGLYVCGPTVYDRIHIGNARPLIVFDVLNRLLRQLFPQVTYVRNITDVDDKIMDRAAERGISIEEVTRSTTEQFHKDTAALGCTPPDHEPRATQHIAGMIRLIETLIANGHAYEKDGNVLFNVPSFAGYGRLSGRDRDEQIAGARVDVAPYKRDPADFVLWKPSAADQPGWDSPWGRGRPGWHIECSAMSEHHLGVPFDIHGGGIDLVFPHHENEIAQTCCARGLSHMANFWLHNGFVTVNGEKMAKSLGNFTTVEDVLAKAPGEAVRLWTLGTHYRSPLDFSWEGIERAKATLDRFYGALARVPALRTNEPENGDLHERTRGRADRTNEPEPALLEALCDDLNTPKALAVLHDLLGRLNRTNEPEDRERLRASGAVLGLLQAEPEAWLKGGSVADDSQEIEAAIAARLAARKGKNFAEADRIRAELSARGIILEDGPGGTTWRRAS
nr:cysteine--tRNA ligase [Geminicoccus roseus]